jgi:4'-phosphopantetheinyl transferase EntD
LTVPLTSLLSRVSMPGVFGSEVLDRGQAVDLDPGEAALVAAAGEKRRRDFALGRFCAHAALAQLGQPQELIGSDARGAPIWPPGICGSITHTSGYAAALVAVHDRFAGIGVDAEPVGGVTENLWPRLFNENERAALTRRKDRAIAATLLFSAKEACFKAGSASGLFSFPDIHVELSEGGFLARSRTHELRGLFAVEEALVVTAAYRPPR